MGEEDTMQRFAFNGSVRVESRPERLTGDAGVLLLRELEENLGFIGELAKRITDPRREDLIIHPLAELLRTALLLPIHGWSDEDDADTLRNDPAFRVAVSDRRGISPLLNRDPEGIDPTKPGPQDPDGLASQPTMSRLLRILAGVANIAVLRDGLRTLAAQRIRAMRPGNHRKRYLTIDVDSMPITVHGNQPGSAYNGYYRRTVYHPLIASIAETGDLLDARLREGNCHTADGALGFILDLVEWAEKELCQVASVRMDAGFPEDNLLSGLEGKRIPYVARIKNNQVLDRMAEPYLSRPPGRPPGEPRTWLSEHRYKAEKWTTDRRVVLVVLERPGELHLHHFWMLTSWPPEMMSGEVLLDHYRERGSAEGYMGELVNFLVTSLPSSPRPKKHYKGKNPKKRYASVDGFACNEALLLLRCISYNLSHCCRVMVEDATKQGWSLQRMRERILRIPARVLLHSRRITVVVANAASEIWHQVQEHASRLDWTVNWVTT